MAWIAAWIWVPGWGLILSLLLLFPNGRLPSWHWWLVAASAIGALVVTMVSLAFMPGQLGWSVWVFRNPFGVEHTLETALSKLVYFSYRLFMVSVLASALSLLFRFYRAVGVEREQIKWLAYTGVMSGIVFLSTVVFYGAAFLGNPWLQVILFLPIIGFPVSMGMAILKYRLYDIDIIINRTMVYGALTASVVGLYALIVGGLGMVLQTQNNLPGIVIAILLIAFLFQPLRRRLQSVVNRFVPVPQIVSEESIATSASPAKREQNIAVSERLPHTTLRGSRLIILRTTWGITALLVLAFIAVGAPNRYIQLTTVSPDANTLVGQLQPEEARAFEQAGLSVPVFAAYITALDIFIAFVFALLGLAVAWLRPEDRIALLISIALISAAMVVVAAGMVEPQWHPVIIIAHAVWGASVIPTLYLFPDGRFVPRWTRWLTVIWLMYTIAWLIVPSISPPFAFGRGFTGYEFPRNVWLLLWGCSGLGAQIYRYRKVSGAVQRQQIKWVVFGFGIGLTALATGISLLTLSRLSPLTLPTVVARLAGISILLLGTLVIPSSIGVSILRYHLFDVDIIINRTLVYGALTSIVVGAFVVLVGFLSTLFQSSGSSIIAILATGLVALFFNPLRQRLQLGVNRLMYGERDDPYAVLSRLGQHLEAAYAPESVLPTIVETVAQTLKLPYVAIALNQEGEFKIAAEFGRSKSEPINLPLIYQGEPVGELMLAPRAPGEHFTASERQLLDDLARPAGVAAHTVRLTADLQRSRERLVAAREEERRRLRRDLHDGLGPQLASLALKLEAARNRMSENPQAVSLLTDLSMRTQDAVADIRRLVYALRPPALDELGLVMALREGTTQYNQQGINGLNITFDAPESLPPLPAAVEVAVYRIAQEALTNVIRHANARTCFVRLKLEESACILCLEVEDDGKGLPMKRRAGVGLNSMRERAEELGGTWIIESLPTGGTRILVRLPCRLPDQTRPTEE